MPGLGHFYTLFMEAENGAWRLNWLHRVWLLSLMFLPLGACSATCTLVHRGTSYDAH